MIYIYYFVRSGYLLKKSERTKNMLLLIFVKFVMMLPRGGSRNMKWGESNL